MKKILLLSISVIICSPNLAYAQTNLVNRSHSPNTTGGSDNTFLGFYSGFINGPGTSRNTYLGSFTGRFKRTGVNNVFIGFNAGRSNKAATFADGNFNVYLGAEAGRLIKGANYNTFLGYRAAYFNNDGSNNTYVGSFAGYASDGYANVFLGYRAGYFESGSKKLYIENSDTSTPLIYGDFAANQVGIDIDTDSIPSGYSFAVAGKIAVEEVLIVKQGNWPDYVFTPEYDLPTIKEVETFIAQNGHLKDIPTAEEVREHGILQGEMDAKLLKKIEELTLYVIELNNTNMELKETDTILNERIQKLEEAVKSKATE